MARKPPARKRIIIGRDAPAKPKKLVNPRRICTADQRLAALRLMRQSNIPDALAGSVFGLTRQQVHEMIGPHEATVPVDKTSTDDLGRQLRAFRARYHLTQTDIARLFGLRSPLTVYGWETGRHACATPDLVLRFLHLLEKHNEIR